MSLLTSYHKHLANEPYLVWLRVLVPSQCVQKDILWAARFEYANRIFKYQILLIIQLAERFATVLIFVKVVCVCESDISARDSVKGAGFLQCGFSINLIWQQQQQQVTLIS